MLRSRLIRQVSLAGLLLAPAAAISGALSAATAQGQAPAAPLVVTAGKSMVLDSPLNIERVSLGSGELAEAVAVNPREILINAKAPGETTLIVWQQGGPRLVYDLIVRPSTSKLEVVNQRIGRELPGQDMTVQVEGDNVFLRGTAQDVVSAQRAFNIAATLGKVVNLLNVVVPAEEPQILLKVKFADVDRSVSQQLGLNIFSTGATRTLGSVSTQQFSPPQLALTGNTATATLTNALNVFLFRPDLNLGTTIEALESKNLLQILAEPNVLAMNGKPASFVAGGEFPVPVVQGGANIGAVTIQFREFGVRLNFLPTVTARGTIRLQVTPEVSSLDYNNSVVLQGFTVPAIATRRVQTEIELESGQSFAVAGLLDNRLTETFNKIPGLGDIPIIGKLFTSRVLNKNNSELLVMVTPELVRPIPAGKAPPVLAIPKEFLHGPLTEAPRAPGIETTGPVPVKPPRETMPLEEFLQMQKKEQGPEGGNTSPPAQFGPVPGNPGVNQPVNQGSQPAPPPANGTGQ
jgi:pilus assembly protein CpaC